MNHFLGIGQTLGCQDQPQRETHHVALDYQIDELAACVADLDDLITRVKSGPTGREIGQCVPRPVRSLADVLASGADRLASARQSITERIRELENLLF